MLKIDKVKSFHIADWGSHGDSQCYKFVFVCEDGSKVEMLVEGKFLGEKLKRLLMNDKWLKPKEPLDLSKVYKDLVRKPDKFM